MKALITGCAGQDGSYLTEHLLNLGYRVYGLVRGDVGRLRPAPGRLELLYGDLRDRVSLETAIRQAAPDELYNLGAQTFVPQSWTCAAETFDVNVGGLARLLSIVQQVKPDTRVYQASSSEMFGNRSGPLSEQDPFTPVSPYGIAKLAAHELCRVYRDRGLYVVGGILFNHESPRRGAEMVTRKITIAAGAWARGGVEKVRLGNLAARRDWGFAGDYVRAMHLMLQQHAPPRDYVIGTGVSHSIRDFVEQVLAELHALTGDERFRGPLENFVEVDPRFIRENEIHELVGDARRACRDLGWKPEVNFSGLVRLMVRSDAGAE